MIAFRRVASNLALGRAVEHARELRKPLVVLEALRSDYPWASDRLHQFVIEGMADQAADFAGTPVTYLPYVEPAPGAGSGLVEALAARAAVVVTDDFPCFFLPRMTATAAARLDVPLESVDSNGLLPMRAAGREFRTAHSFRAHVQRALPGALAARPSRLDLGDLPSAPPRAVLAPILARWPMAGDGDLTAPARLVRALPIDHGVAPGAFAGGARAARGALRRFVDEALARYAEEHNQPEARATSGLSPYLHFGHISSHEVFDAVMTAERWTTRRLPRAAGGKREGWWRVGAGANAFLDQLVTWRELGLNACVERPDDYWRYSAVPAWARATLAAHAADRRAHLYARDELERAATHDPLWNAAARQLARDGWMHNYLRMLWAKKILEWSPSPQAALETMTGVMNRHALDGRDPNSYTGYLWTLGRYDRPWGPEREIFGTVRYMSSDSARRKLRLTRFLEAYGPSGDGSRLPPR